MRDVLTRAERSAHMAKVRSKGNKSTEQVVEAALKGARIRGWVKHPQDIIGRPDFYFRRARLALFVDGCFWHACPRCHRRTPATRSEFWRQKIDQNRHRDERIRRRLRASGCGCVRVWEHELRQNLWLDRLLTVKRRRTEKTRQ